MFRGATLALGGTYCEDAMENCKWLSKSFALPLPGDVSLAQQW
jgi:hypothetical protein